MTREEKNQEIYEEEIESLEDTIIIEDNEDDNYERNESSRKKTSNNKSHSKKKNHNNEDKREKNQEEKQKNTRLSKTEQEELKEKQKKKKIMIIISAIILVIGVIICLLMLNKEKKIVNNDNFKSILIRNIKDGSLEESIKDNLDNLGNNSTSVSIMFLDIDSDDDKELLVYASNNKNDLLVYEISNDVSFANSYSMDNIESLGYLYSINNTECYWFTLYEKNYEIISDSNISVSAESFVDDYYVVENKYNNKFILEDIYDIEINAITDQLHKDISYIIDEYYTNDEFLNNNNIDKDKLKEIIINKRKEEEKKKEEEELKKQQEEAKKEEEANKVIDAGEYELNYGTYVGGGNSYTLNSDNTFKYASCKGTYLVKYDSNTKLYLVMFKTTNSNNDLCNTKYKVTGNNKFSSMDDSISFLLE